MQSGNGASACQTVCLPHWKKRADGCLIEEYGSNCSRFLRRHMFHGHCWLGAFNSCWLLCSAGKYFQTEVLCMRILIVEDERRLAATLADILEHAGYQVDRSFDGTEGEEMAEDGMYDAIILDIMLPGLNGFEILRRLRQKKCMTPVLILTARSELENRVRGLDAGADYYLTKPFENEEFLACLRTILRRPAEIVTDILSYGDLILNPSVSRLSCRTLSVALSAKERKLLRMLIHNQNQYLSKEAILLKIWGYYTNVNTNSVEAYISFLRKKLAFLHSSVRISVVRGIGYKLEVSE